MQDHLGTIFGSVGESRFRFLTTERGHVKSGDYVKMNHEEGVVLGQVGSIVRETPIPDRALSLPKKEGEDRLVAETVVIGYRDPRGAIQSPKSPFRAGEKVYRADDLLMERVLGLSGDGAELGHLHGTTLGIRLDINHLVQKHASVLAKTGAGKSYVVGVLMEELLKRGIPIVIIDPHGEHTSLAEPNVNRQDMSAMRRFGVKPKGYAEAIAEYSPDAHLNRGALPLRLDGTGLGLRELSDVVGSRLSSAQFGILHQALKTVAARHRKYTIAEIAEEAKAHPSPAKWNLVGALEFLDGLNLFHSSGTPVTSLAKRGQASVINLRGIPPEVQEIVVTWVAKGLFEARKQNRVPPLMLVVEEAHHFCPERGFQQAISGDVLRTIASEGRKFGLGLLIVSQRPAKVDKNVLSQCGTQLILKVTNPNDLRAITNSVEGLTSETEEELQRLPVGVAIVSHPRFPFPLQVDVRPRETRHGGRSVNVLGHWAPDAAQRSATPDDEPADQRDEDRAATPSDSEETIQDEPSESAIPETQEPAGKGKTQDPIEAQVAAAHEPSRKEAPDEWEGPAIPAQPSASEKRIEPPASAPHVERIEMRLELEAEDPEPSRLEDDELEYRHLPSRPRGPEEAASYIDLCRICERVERFDLATLEARRLQRLLQELARLEPTVAGLAVEFPQSAAVAELRERMRASRDRVDRARRTVRMRGLYAKLRPR